MPSTAVVELVPDRPASVTAKGRARGILVKCPHPTAWAGMSAGAEGFDKSEVAYFIFRLLDSAGNVILTDAEDFDSGPVLTNHHYFPLTRAQAGSQAANGVITWTDYTCDVEAFGWDEQSNGKRTNLALVHAASLTASAAPHNHTGGGHRHGKQHRHTHSNTHQHSHGGHSHPPGSHNHPVPVHSHSASGGYTSGEMNTHSTSGHDHTIGSQINHNHGIQHNHTGTTGGPSGTVSSFPAAGPNHTHSIPSLTNAQSDPDGGHAHVMIGFEASHTHNHTSGLNAKPTNENTGFDTQTPSNVNTGGATDNSNFNFVGDTDDDTAQTDLTTPTLTDADVTLYEIL